MRRTAISAALARATLMIPAALWCAGASPCTAGDPVTLGDRLELFADDFLIAHREGALAFEAQRPEPREVVLVLDAPWEGNTSAYYTLFQDGARYRMYYRGSAVDPVTRKRSLHPEVACVAESEDGIHWTRPKLGLFEFGGSKENNIVWGDGPAHNFTPFRDANPACAPDARYKAFVGGRKRGLLALASPDGLRWRKLREEPVITAGAFDSQNLAFWDGTRGEYRAYWRIFTNKVRAIRTAVSKDFLEWTGQADVVYGEGTPPQHLYTNAVLPYSRAPHLFLGFPTRFLPDEGQRVEPLFMIGRDGTRFSIHPRAVIPEDAPQDRRGNRSNYMAWGLLSLPGHPGELSVYGTEAYYGPVPTRLRRFAYRTDRFVALRAGAAGGAFETRPIVFRGTHLELNCAARPGGEIRVAVLAGSDGAPAGFGSAECEPLTGDHPEAAVRWRGGGDLGALAGKPVRLRFEARDADLFAMRFR